MGLSRVGASRAFTLHSQQSDFDRKSTSCLSFISFAQIFAAPVSGFINGRNASSAAEHHGLPNRCLERLLVATLWERVRNKLPT